MKLFCHSKKKNHRMKLKRGNNVKCAFDNISKQKDELNCKFVILVINYFRILIIQETRLIRSYNLMTKMGVPSRKIKKKNYLVQ